jgi:hypothetical protein
VGWPRGAHAAAGDDVVGRFIHHDHPAGQTLGKHFGNIDFERGMVGKNVSHVSEDAGVALITMLYAESASTKHAFPFLMWTNIPPEITIVDERAGPIGLAVLTATRLRYYL